MTSPARTVTVDDCLSIVEITEPQISPDGRWIALVLNGESGARLVRVDLDAFRSGPAVPRYVTSVEDLDAWSPWPVRAGRGLGGGCFSWMPDSSGVVAAARDGVLWLLPLEGVARRVVTDMSASSPMVDPTGRYIVFVVDQAQIHVVDSTTGVVERVDDGRWDFVSDPLWWKGRPWWTAWNVPHMPWDASTLVSAEEQVGPSSCQLQQPRVSPDGTDLGWLDDTSGWLNLQIAEGRRVAEPFEHGQPSWGERQRSWCFDPNGGTAAFTRNESGFGRLCTVDLATGQVVERAKAVHGQLSWSGRWLVALRTGGKTPTRVVLYDTATWERSDVIVGSAAAWDGHPALVEPSLVEVPASDGTPLHARLYRSTRSNGRLLCWIHGGPTDQWMITFMPRFAYWLDRGYSILVPDHRGSSGHGRAFAQALQGRWGEVDVDDVADVLRRVCAIHGYRSNHVAVLGSSAGGMTALALVARQPEVAAAVVVAYPVSDIAGLDAVTHRFEAHYNRFLMGSPIDTEQRSQERSPIHRPAALAAVPILLFHGTEDPVVPIGQSIRLVESIRAHGGLVEDVVFEGEGHGFRRRESKIVEFERTELFLRRHLGVAEPLPGDRDR